MSSETNEILHTNQSHVETSPEFNYRDEDFTDLFVPEKFNGENYRVWAKFVKREIEGRGKLGLITGECEKPDESNLSAMKKWEVQNAIVSLWLINSMTPEVRGAFMFEPTAQAIREAVRDCFDMKEDPFLLYLLNRKFWLLEQGEREVIDYWLELADIWQKIDLNKEEEKWACDHDAAIYRKRVNDDRVFQFLAGLNESLDGVRRRILERSSLPSLGEVFAEVRQEASFRKVMSKSSTLVSEDNTDRGKRWSKGRLSCDYCKKTGHSQDTCWDLHGKPPNWKPRRGKSRGYHVQYL